MTAVRVRVVAAVVVCALALGIGATVTMVAAAVLRPVRLPDADRLVALVYKDQRFGTGPLAPPDLRTCVSACAASTAARACRELALGLTGSGDARQVTVAHVSDDLFALFHVTPAHLTFAVVTWLLLVTAAGASCIPARRVLRLDPCRRCGWSSRSHAEYRSQPGLGLCTCGSLPDE